MDRAKRPAMKTSRALGMAGEMVGLTTGSDLVGKLVMPCVSVGSCVCVCGACDRL